MNSLFLIVSVVNRIKKLANTSYMLKQARKVKKNTCTVRNASMVATFSIKTAENVN